MVLFSRSREMPILRVKKEQRRSYVIMDTRPLSDPRLSWKAKGILAYLLGKPNDWTVRVRDLVKRSPDGDYAVQSGLDELMEFGYVTREQHRTDAGKFAEVEYIVREAPLGGFPVAGFPVAGGPVADNHVLTNDDCTNDEYTNGEPDENDTPDDVKFLGPRPPVKPRKSHTPESVKADTMASLARYEARVRKEPWRGWFPDRVHPRGGISAHHLQHIGWLVEQVTGIVPRNDQTWNRWRPAYEAMYKQAEGDFRVIEQAIRNKWPEEERYRTANPDRYIEEVAKLAAEPAGAGAGSKPVVRVEAGRK
jgi:hypothetical protein